MQVWLVEIEEIYYGSSSRYLVDENISLDEWIKGYFGERYVIESTMHVTPTMAECVASTNDDEDECYVVAQLMTRDEALGYLSHDERCKATR